MQFISCIYLEVNVGLDSYLRISYWSAMEDKIKNKARPKVDHLPGPPVVELVLTECRVRSGLNGTAYV